MRRLASFLSLLTFACSGPGPTTDVTVDAQLPSGGSDTDGGSDTGGDIWNDDPDPNVRFLTAPPAYPACAQNIAFKPQGGYHGGVLGQKRCGPASPNCPTTYIEGNTGAPCTSASDCTGKDPVCLTGSKYPGGVCAATGCEFGSNRGCPQGDYCMNPGDGQTYCVEGCGIDETSCFKHCSRDGFACFTTESTSLGMCLGADGTRECNPTASATCTNPAFGDGVCGQTAWDDQTIGRCFETCDPLDQDCSRDGTACYALFEYRGYPVCFQHQGEQDGSKCVRTTECGEGLRCSCDDGSVPCTAEKHCRAYCTTDGDYPCANPTYFCRALTEGGRLGSCHPKSG